MAADQNLGEHDRCADEKHRGEVDEDEAATLVLVGDVRELPDIAEADGRAGGGQDESHTPEGPSLLSHLAYQSPMFTGAARDSSTALRGRPRVGLSTLRVSHSWR